MKNPTYYLAIDFGASSGRHILGHLEDGEMKLEEVYRFENGVSEKNGHLCWDFDHLWNEVLAGLRRCREIGKIPSYMGIDTWGVDFVLLDGEDRVLGDTVAYRDSRTDGMAEVVYKKISAEELFRRTGVVYQPFNTLYQLVALREQEPALLAEAKSLLLVPAYFNFLLTGEKLNEYTMASTSQLVDAETRNWDYELLGKLNLPAEIFGDMHMPGELVGTFTKEVREAVGFDCRVLLPACHDTASAVAAVPCEEDFFAYISSGTWSLFGTELREANTLRESFEAGFTNEGGYEGRYRFLKNIMGLWMIQSARREWKAEGKDLSFAEICAEASKCDDFAARVAVEDNRFLAPDSMIAEVQAACRETGGPVPETVGEIAAVIYHSLADCYARTMEQMESITGEHFEALCIVGGGSQADYLNELTAKAVGRPVLAGPSEATAIGNLAVQMIASGEIENLLEARHLIKKSFAVKRIEA
ncbi:MAG: rhamnulokinase [Clostridia bacterium]|nr:rhamnulokinase [Clostridia bacterium]